MDAPADVSCGQWALSSYKSYYQTEYKQIMISQLVLTGRQAHSFVYTSATTA
jgi:hypothetical protein